MNKEWKNVDIRTKTENKFISGFINTIIRDDFNRKILARVQDKINSSDRFVAVRLDDPTVIIKNKEETTVMINKDDILAIEEVTYLTDEE